VTALAARRLASLALAAAIGPLPVSAQAVRPVWRAPRAERLSADSALVSNSELLARLDLRGSASSRRAFTTSASVIGGAVLGSFLGYFMSQVVKSDWEGERTGDRADHRRRFAISGAAVGAISGYLVRPRGPRARPEPPAFYVYVAPSARHYITVVELRRAVATNALEAVQVLRPEWLATGQFASQSTANGSPPMSADAGIAIYAVDTRIGGLEALADAAIPEIEELRLYEPREAARRWGSPHPYSAIEIVPSATRTTR
jgi:hypothetical protein